ENYEDYPTSAFESTEGVYALEKMSQKVLALRKTLQTAFEEHTTEEERNGLPQLLEEALENQTVAQQLQ
ncbi:27433_t:CDS:2, partial [Racocetra persica]